MHLSGLYILCVWGGVIDQGNPTLRISPGIASGITPDPGHTPQAHTLLRTQVILSVYWGLTVNFKGSGSHTIIVLCLHLAYSLCLDSPGGRIEDAGRKFIRENPEEPHLRRSEESRISVGQRERVN